MTEKFSSGMTSEIERYKNEKQAEVANAPAAAPEPKKKSRTAFVFFFALFMFFIFLFNKLPEARIQNLVIAYIRIAVQNQGLSFNAEKIRTGIFFGPSLKITNIDIKSLEDDKQTLHIDSLKIRPHLLSFIFNNHKASISAELLDGEISGVIGMGTNDAIIDLSMSNVNLARATLLKKFILVQANGVISGKIKTNFSFADMSKTSGEIFLTLKKASLPPQAVMGINLPAINISDSNVDGVITAGKLALKNVYFGKDLKTDDIVAKVTGDITLNQSLDRSQANFGTVFELSPRLIQAFPFLEAILGGAKGADGKYAYKFSGPFYALEPKPGQ